MIFLSGRSLCLKVLFSYIFISFCAFDHFSLWFFLLSAFLSMPKVFEQSLFLLFILSHLLQTLLIMAIECPFQFWLRPKNFRPGFSLQLFFSGNPPHAPEFYTGSSQTITIGWWKGGGEKIVFFWKYVIISTYFLTDASGNSSNARKGCFFNRDLQL